MAGGVANYFANPGAAAGAGGAESYLKDDMIRAGRATHEEELPRGRASAAHGVPCRAATSAAGRSSAAEPSRRAVRLG
jgi:hypothetical protein